MATLITDAIGKVWDTTDDRAGVFYTQFLKEYKTPHARAISIPVAYFGEVGKLAEGSALDYDDIEVGTALEIAPEQFAKGFRATRAALLDMAKNPFGEFSTQKIVSAANLGKAFKDSWKQTLDVYGAQVLLSGNSASASAKWIGAGNNGEALYADTHTILKGTAILGSTTYDNLGAASTLSQGALNTLIESTETMPSQEGMLRSYSNKWTLVTGPANRTEATEAVYTAKMNKVADSFDQTKPALSNYDITPVINPFLGASSTRYAIFSDKAQVYYWIPDNAQIEDEKDFETKGHKWSVYGRFRFFHTDSFGTVLSLGA